MFGESLFSSADELSQFGGELFEFVEVFLLLDLGAKRICALAFFWCHL